MTDGLSVIRRAYGLDGAAPASGADAIEAAVLDHSIRALDALPAASPDPAAMAQVLARAAEASQIEPLAAIRGALGLGPVQETVEGAVLAQSVAALDTLPRETPAPEVVVSVESAAQQATLAPILSASGEAASAPAGPEVAVLQQSLAALDTLPVSTPSDGAMAAVLAFAAEASADPLLGASGDAEKALLQQSLSALDTLPVSTPSDGAMAAVLAFAADATQEASGEIELTADGVEGVVLQQSLAALDTLPAEAPSAAAMATVLAFAADATFAPLRAALGEMDAFDTPEAALLAQSLAALGTLPTYSPLASTLDAVADETQRATFAPILAAWGEADALDTPEAALLAQSREALDALPRYTPSDAALAAVMAAAATASGAAPVAAASAVASGARAPVAPARRQRRAADRTAVAAAPASRSSHRTGAWAGIATLAVAVIVGVMFLQSPDASLAPEAEIASADIAAFAPQPAPEAAPRAVAPQREETEPEPLATAPAPAPRTIVQRTAPSGPSAEGFQAVAARRSALTPAAPQRTAPTASAAPGAGLAAADLAPSDLARAAATDPEWEAGEDLRLLSLRLRELRENTEGVEWDGPAASLDARGAAVTGTTRGLQVVRETAPVGRALVRTQATNRR